ncbi:uncharacterized protein BO66DRAFT_450611 [Aspergillus aculeatinus CBS 121060]|uniref:Uncharacterized protein n=1 Tax=Aspergillus aculeatinus CBS 121060 TaxID=1448322 RepID=A0ACD1HAT0_9EURO|nr:hypothetical protein BO66DRAFT_450611 [Aspergillus aculeatinus CBS 121060]RAH70740.1 hypothetical protein BO66DRAFT_450611 [Aspergillus aculeatinus CBS 121060]
MARRSITSSTSSDVTYNVMKAGLDQGALKPGSIDRDFTKFLDLKSAHQRKFLESLRDHVHFRGFEWGELLNSEATRRTCAEIFVDSVGRTYWGTEENRRKYLMEDSFNDPNALCVYPDRREEIIRTIMILIERKAKSALKPRTDKEPSKVRPSLPSNDSTGFTPLDTSTNMASHMTSSSKRVMTPAPHVAVQVERKPKRKSKSFSDEEYRETDSAVDDTDDVQEYTPSMARQVRRSSTTRIRPFKSIMTSQECDIDSDSDPMMVDWQTKWSDPAKTKQERSRPVKIEPTPPAKSFDIEKPDYSPIKMEPPASRKKRKSKSKKHSLIRQESPEVMNLDEPVADDTFTITTVTPGVEANPDDPDDPVYFLVTATSQPGMGSVWVPYRDFRSAEDFMRCLRQECRLDNWSPSRQLSHDVSGHSPTTMKPVVVAASVKFDWTDFEIRVRQHHDQDWAMVQQELQKAMEGRTQLLESGSLTSAFKIRVLLHVVEEDTLLADPRDH